MKKQPTAKKVWLQMSPKKKTDGLSLIHEGWSEVIVKNPIV
jgi:hypothetical protein